MKKFGFIIGLLVLVLSAFANAGFFGFLKGKQTPVFSQHEYATVQTAAASSLEQGYSGVCVSPFLQDYQGWQHVPGNLITGTSKIGFHPFTDLPAFVRFTDLPVRASLAQLYPSHNFW